MIYLGSNTNLAYVPHIRNAKMDVIVVWHHPRRDDYSCEPASVGRETLYGKLLALDLQDLEKLRDL